MHNSYGMKIPENTPLDRMFEYETIIMLATDALERGDVETALAELKKAFSKK